MVADIDMTLQQLVQRWGGLRFAWGTVDCCHLARDAAAALHGLQVVLPRYSTERGAVRVLRRLGGLERALRDVGLRPHAPAAACRGDIVQVHHVGRGALGDEALAVCTGIQAHNTGSDGLVAVPRAYWIAAWRPEHG